MKEQPKEQIRVPEERARREQRPDANLNISAPIALWIGLVLVAAVVQLGVAPFISGAVVGPYLSLASTLAIYILYIPGVFIIPMVAALWIGAKVGATQGDYNTILYRSLLNALYASMIYVIVVFVVLVASLSLQTGTLYAIGLTQFIEYVVAIPVLIAIVVVPLFGIVSTARKY